jgi:hypothetical protein
MKYVIDKYKNATDIDRVAKLCLENYEDYLIAKASLEPIFEFFIKDNPKYIDLHNMLKDSKGRALYYFFWHKGND